MGRAGRRNTRYKTKNRKTDIDEIFEDSKPENAPKHLKEATKFDEEKPALGQHYCLPCHRHFLSAEVLLQHQRTKPHKRQLKRLLTDPHTQADAEWAAGIQPAVPSKQQQLMATANKPQVVTEPFPSAEAKIIVESEDQYCAVD